jgi:MFS transporter, DHA1 family, multidrug resistance protein
MNKKTQKSRLIIWILGGLSTVTPFAIDLYLPAFSKLAEEFHTTPARISLSVSSYFIGMAIGQILYGPLLDRFGRRIPLYIGLAIFLLCSIGCMQSRDVNTLVVFRFVQALGGSVAWVAALTMVRDFFPVEQSARIFSLLFLVIGVSPLLAPTIGGFIVVALTWKWIFILMCMIVVFIIAAVYFFLPTGYQPDRTISLRPDAMGRTFMSILGDPQFATYAFAGAFGFSTLFIYVAGSPVIFMENYHVDAKTYGGIFALLSVGFIGGSQLNIYLNKRYSSQKLFQTFLITQVLAAIIFLILTLVGLLNLYITIGMLFIILSCIGITNPNASALAIAPFTRNVGSASALMGFAQIGIAALASSGIGLFNSKDIAPSVTLMFITAAIALAILFFGQRKIGPQIVGKSGNQAPFAH